MSIFRNIDLFEKNDKVVNNKFILFFVNLFFNFPIKYIFKYSKINYLYKIDSVYFYENYSQLINSIYPVILNFKLLDINDNKILNEIDILDKIKMYNFNVPIKIFLINENIKINEYNTIVIKTLKSKTDKKFNIDESINYIISDFL
jgi:hypothetical protein